MSILLSFNATDSVLATAISKGIALAEKTGQFVIDQAPELIQEFILFKTYENIMSIIACIIGIILPCFVLYKVYKKNDEDEVLENPIIMIICFFLMLIAIFSAVIIPFEISNLIKITTAPKIYIIEYFFNK